MELVTELVNTSILCMCRSQTHNRSFSKNSTQEHKKRAERNIVLVLKTTHHLTGSTSCRRALWSSCVIDV